MPPTTFESDTTAIHRCLLDTGADPKLIHPAIEAIRNLSGHNIVAAIGTQIAESQAVIQTQIVELRAEMQTQIVELRAEMQTQITEHRAETSTQFRSLRAEISTLNRVIWPLITLLAVPMFGLLYKILTQ